jgi:hypothetical protein
LGFELSVLLHYLSHASLQKPNFKKNKVAGCWWLMPVILASQETEIRRIVVQSQPRKIVHKTLSRKYPSQKGLEEWLKVKTLRSSPSTSKKKKEQSWRTFPTLFQELFLFFFFLN